MFERRQGASEGDRVLGAAYRVAEDASDNSEKNMVTKPTKGPHCLSKCS
jgi:hypothetical protein